MNGLCECGCGEATRIALRSNYRIGHVKGEPIRFVFGHQRRKSGVEYIVQDMGYKTPCWIWQRAIDHKGYGRVGMNPAPLAHRVVFARFHPLPPEDNLDHLCRVRSCVNPNHLEIATRVVNNRRGLQAKITQEIADEIRRKLRVENWRQKDLGTIYGLSQTQVSCIHLGKCWA